MWAHKLNDRIDANIANDLPFCFLLGKFES